MAEAFEQDRSCLVSPTPPVALTIAGTDTGGSAGLAADLKTFARHGVHGVFALTVATAQNTTGISSVHSLPATFVAEQVDAVTRDFNVAATKTGLLFSLDAVEVVIERAPSLGPLVIDPVLVTSAGVPMLAEEMTSLYRDRLIPLAAVTTPNVAEAALLSGIEITDRNSAFEAAAVLAALGPEAVVITGLLEERVAVDIVALDGQVEAIEHERIPTRNVLGTGCSLSAAITALLASGVPVEHCIGPAASFVLAGLESAMTWRLGEGRGPIDHFAEPNTRDGHRG